MPVASASQVESGSQSAMIGGAGELGVVSGANLTSVSQRLLQVTPSVLREWIIIMIIMMIIIIVIITIILMIIINDNINNDNHNSNSNYNSKNNDDNNHNNH
jgi:ATP/ADP translocase